jgi:predicted phage terminase large subunit-like protein
MQAKVIKSIRKLPYKKIVFNLKIKDNHNYFANGVLVHNCDDPNDAAIFTSKVKREADLDWFFGRWSTRENNEDSVSLVVQQRFHQEDISGAIIDNDSKGNWVKLILPMEFENSRRCSTIIMPSTQGKIWSDPRLQEGELLNPDRFNRKKVEELKEDLRRRGGEQNVAGQLQQRPSPDEGGIIKKQWFQWWKEAKYPRFSEIIQSWDTALSGKKESAYHACTTWGLFKNEHQVPQLMLLGMWRDHIEYPELRKVAQRLATDYRDDGKDKNFVALSQYKPSLILVESKASGFTLIQDFQRAGILCVGFNPDKYGDKESRVHIVSQLIEGGRIWVPAMAPHFNQLKPFASKFIEECALFPASSSRDLVDTMTQVLLRLMGGRWLTNPRDYEDEDAHAYKPRGIYGPT